MKYLQFAIRLIILVFILFGLVSHQTLAQVYPRPIGYINDFAQILSPDTRTRLEDRLKLLEKETSAEVAFVSVDSLRGFTLEEYSAGLFSDWGIGKKGKDNGVLFLVSLAEGDIKIEVGYGLESVITDGRAGRILDKDVLPYLKKGDIDSGVEAGIISIETYIRDGTPPQPIEENPIRNMIDNFDLPYPLLIGLGVISIYVLGFMARTKSIWLGGVWGFILGLVLGFGFGKLVFLISLPIALAILGTLLDAILSSNYWGRQSIGLPTGWFSSRGGFGGPSGGFSGFGGGKSGGGGASRHY